jgi:HK97 family phage major capsid protein
MLEFLKKQLEKLLEERGALKSELDGVIAVPQAEKRDLNEAETKAFDEKRAAVKAKDDEIDAMQARVKDAEEDEARSKRVSQLRAETAPDEKRTETARQGGATVTHEASVYGERDARGRIVKTDPHVSYVRDMFTVATNGYGVADALERLGRNNQEIEARALTTTAGAGGEFAPPAWLVAEFVTLARAARPTADRVMNETLPMGISSVNIPKLLTGTATAQQATQNTAVQATDATTGSVTAAIVTIAGQQVVSQQLLDQSGVNIDNILLQDLAFDYAAKVDLFVLNNNATNAKGLLQQSGTTGLTYTSGTPTTKLLYGQIAAAIAGVQAARFLPPDTIIMHPRRWAAFVAAADSTGRPLISPAAGAMNAPGTIDRSYSAQGPVGQIAGLDVITDPQVPINLGAGTNQDAVIVMRAADAILWEGDLKSEAFRETKADQLSVLLRVYNYAAFTANRYAASTALITGTGLVTPTYDGS